LFVSSCVLFLCFLHFRNWLQRTPVKILSAHVLLFIKCHQVSLLFGRFYRHSKAPHSLSFLFLISSFHLYILCFISHFVYVRKSYRIVSYRIVSYRIVSYRIVSYRIVSYWIDMEFRNSCELQSTHYTIKQPSNYSFYTACLRD